jgi:hypothetical protein
MRAGTRSLTGATIRGRCKSTWVIRTFSTWCDTLSCRRRDSRTSGENERCAWQDIDEQETRTMSRLRTRPIGERHRAGRDIERCLKMATFEAIIVLAASCGRCGQRDSDGSPFIFVSERGAPVTAVGFSRMVERAAPVTPPYCWRSPR